MNLPQAANSRTVDVSEQYKTQPVTIENVTVGDEQIQPGASMGVSEVHPGSPFQAGDDWMKTMTLVLRNRTDKEVSEIEIQLFFPDTGDGRSQPMRSSLVDLGRRPDNVSYVHPRGTPQGTIVYHPQGPDKKPLALPPGQTLVVHLADYISEIESDAGMPLSRIKTVIIDRSLVYFDDGLRWDDLTSFSVLNADHNKFNPLPRTYFPGNIHNYWPANLPAQ